MSLIVVVDGGGSRCRLAAFSSASGEVLGRVTVEGHASLTSGVTEAWHNIRHGIRTLARQLKLEPGWFPDTLVMGLAGSLQQKRRQEFLKLVPAQTHTILVTDGQAQLMGASHGKPGICLAVGTGSVLHWRDSAGELGMAGGWGFPVGDEGSGAWLGMRLVQAFIWHRDGLHQESSLMAAVEQRTGTTVSAIQQWTTQSQSSVLAQLAPLVFEHASEGDALALSLVDEAVMVCLKLIALAPQNLPVYVVGGVGEQLSKQLQVELGDRYGKAGGDALHGLWRLAASSA